MTSQLSPNGMLKDKGRPRSFSDETVFSAVTQVAQAQGFAGLTLAAVARRIGCTAQALNARFGSRMELLIAYADWAIERDMDRFRQVRRDWPSPLAAIRARFLLPVQGREEELSGSGDQIRMLSLFAEAQHHPEFAQRMKRRTVAFEEQLSQLIREAAAAGELEVESPDDLAHLLVLVTLGGSALWSITDQGSVLDEITHIVDCALAPYLVNLGE